MGKHVSAFTTSEKKIDFLKKLGADKIIISTDLTQMNDLKEVLNF